MILAKLLALTNVICEADCFFLLRNEPHFSTVWVATELFFVETIVGHLKFWQNQSLLQLKLKRRKKDSVDKQQMKAFQKKVFQNVHNSILLCSSLCVSDEVVVQVYCLSHPPAVKPAVTQCLSKWSYIQHPCISQVSSLFFFIHIVDSTSSSTVQILSSSLILSTVGVSDIPIFYS